MLDQGKFNLVKDKIEGAKKKLSKLEAEEELLIRQKSDLLAKIKLLGFSSFDEASKSLAEKEKELEKDLKDLESKLDMLERGVVEEKGSEEVKENLILEDDSDSGSVPLSLDDL